MVKSPRKLPDWMLRKPTDKSPLQSPAKVTKVKEAKNLITKYFSPVKRDAASKDTTEQVSPLKLPMGRWMEKIRNA